MQWQCYAAVIVFVLLMLHIFGFFKVFPIVLDQKNRMLRAGFGLHDGKWFARVDLWFMGFRFTR
jgi:hypothetical protein